MEVSIVIPLYNEEKNVKELMGRLKSSLAPLNIEYEIIIVNDGSDDNTAKILYKYFECKDVRVINLIKHYGQSIANRAGIENSFGKYIVCMDGDLQHKPEYLPKIIGFLNDGFDLVSCYNTNKSRKRIGSIIAHKLISLVCKTNLVYYAISVKAFQRELINPKDLFGNMHRYIGIVLAQKAKRIKELPITIEERGNGKSNYQNKYWSVLIELFTIKLMLKDVSGMSKYFRSIGFILGFAGFIGIVITILFDLFGNTNIGESFMIEFIFLNFIVIIGILFFTLGVLLHIYQKESTSRPYVIKSFNK